MIRKNRVGEQPMKWFDYYCLSVHEKEPKLVGQMDFMSPK
jgi:hypothetical protein